MSGRVSFSAALDWTSPAFATRQYAVTVPAEGSLRSVSGGGAGASDLTGRLR
jgi:hypothetical protein